MKHFQQNAKSEHNLKLKKILQKMPTFYSNHAKSQFSQDDKSLRLIQKQNEQNDLQYYAQGVRDIEKKKKLKNNMQAPKVLKQFRMFKRSLKELDIQKNKENRRRNYSQKNLQTKSLCRSKNNRVEDLKHKIQLDKQKHSKKYRILKSLGYTQQQVFRMKSQDLNQKLNQFVKHKGLQYLRQQKNKTQYQINRSKTEPIQKLKTIHQKLPTSKHVSSKRFKTKQQDQHYQNDQKQKYRYKQQKSSKNNCFPQINEQLKLKKQMQINKSRSNKSINSLRQKKVGKKLIKDESQNELVKRQLIKKLLPRQNNRKQGLSLIQKRQDILGKIVFQKVKSHLKIKKQPNYFDRVKSQQNVDGALIQFLKMKINRAQFTLK